MKEFSLTRKLLNNLVSHGCALKRCSLSLKFQKLKRKRRKKRKKRRQNRKSLNTRRLKKDRERRNNRVRRNNSPRKRKSQRRKNKRRKRRSLKDNNRSRTNPLLRRKTPLISSPNLPSTLMTGKENSAMPLTNTPPSNNSGVNLTTKDGPFGRSNTSSTKARELLAT
jgi:hypothetical protein